MRDMEKNGKSPSKISKDQLQKFYFWEKDRKESFKHWPFSDESPCNVTKMAEAGFYWCGNEHEIDSVACFLCNKHLDGWEVDDNPWTEHTKHAPQCHFAKNGKPEGELTVGEMLNIFEIMLKNNVERKLAADKKVVKDFVEFHRKALTKSFYL